MGGRNRYRKYEAVGHVPLVNIPAVKCPACSAYAYFAHLAGTLCFYCKQSNFVHRGEWDWSWCPVCEFKDPFCKICHGRGVVGARITKAIDTPAA